MRTRLMSAAECFFTSLKFHEGTLAKTYPESNRADLSGTATRVLCYDSKRTRWQQHKEHSWIRFSSISLRSMQ